MSDAFDDDRVTRWPALYNDVMTMVTRAKHEPDYLAGLGIELVQGAGLKPGEEAADAPLWRACARHVMPADFKWEIVTAIGGKCFLVLQGFTESTS